MEAAIDRNPSTAGHVSLAASPVFAALRPETAARLAERAETKKLGAGARVFDQGESPRQLLVLESGRVILVGRYGSEPEAVVEFAAPGEALALPAVVLNAPTRFAARASVASSLIAIPARLVRECLLSDAAFAVSVAEALARQLHRQIGHNLDLKLRSAPRRLAAYLLDLCGGSNGSVTLQHERRHIAGLLGMTPESLSRAFAQLDAMGVHGRGHEIQITDADRLREFSTFVGADPDFSAAAPVAASS